MLHHTRRWNRDHSEELQSSWMNGTGMLVWDAVFGSWVGWNERDISTLRSMVRAQRAFADVLIHGDWTPLVDVATDAPAAGVYASQFRGDGTALWTIVNRGDADYVGPVIRADCGAAASWFEVTTGSPLPGPDADVRVPARGVAGVVAIAGAVTADARAMLDAAAADRSSADATFPDRLARRRPPPVSSSPHAEISAVPLGPGPHSIVITYRLRETGMYDGAPFVDAWKPLPPLLHSEVSDTRSVEIGSVAVASSEVTNREYATFVEATGYEPLVPDRFAAHWRAAGSLGIDGTAPMTFVNLADARAYATWRGARLPTEFEWQLAADDLSFSRGRPLVWNLTESEHSDGITRFVILKGGSEYQADGSEWYFDGGPRSPSFCAKLLLAGLGVERSSRIGFRLAWDTGTAASGREG
jgi:hypothetical protein